MPDPDQNTSGSPAAQDQTIPGSRMATVALTLSLLAFPLLVTWNILLVATPSVAALILGYRARRSIGDSDQIDHRRARDRAGVAMALGAVPIVLAILILVFLVAGAYG